MPRILLTLTLAGLLTGCLAQTLRHPAEDHHVQAEAIAASCATDGYGEGKCTQDDLDAMAAQAECIDAITKGKKCGSDAAP